MGPLFIARDSNNNDETEAIVDSNVVEDDVVDYDIEEIIEIAHSRVPSESQITTNIVFVVMKLRKITKYIRSSVIAKEKLAHYQKLTGTKNLGVELDFRTRWNSTYKMLVKLIRLKTQLKRFLDYLTSPEGKREFNRKILPRIDETEWALVTGVCMLLQPFNKITSILSGEKYPTFVYALPYLASIHSFLRNDNLFSVNVNNIDDATVGVKTVFETYGDDPNFQQAMGNLKVLQKLLLRDFCTRFSNLSDDIMWTTTLDPRCRQLNHLNSFQKIASKQMLIDNVFHESLLEIEQSGLHQSPVEDSNVQ